MGELKPDLLSPPDPSRLDAIRRYRRRQFFDPRPGDEDAPRAGGWTFGDGVLLAAWWLTAVWMLALAWRARGW